MNAQPTGLFLGSVWAILLATAQLATVPRADADEFSGVRNLVERLLQRDKIPSIAVSVAHRGEIVWEEGFGFANLETRRPATPHTVYRICSVSKVLSASAIMILVDPGLIDLDAPVDDYLGEAKLTARVGNAREATIRRMASHSAGLPVHEQIYYRGESYQPTPADSIESQIARYGNIVRVPGERPQYSNLGYGILSHIVELQSGNSFVDFMHDEVFAPLGMEHSSVGLSDHLKPSAAMGYLEGETVPYVWSSTPGAGEVWSSAHDLVRFGAFHLKRPFPGQKAILSKRLLDTMKDKISSDSDSDFGIGWGTDDDYQGTGYRAVGNRGANVGWHALLILVPDEELAIAALSNSNGTALQPMVNEVIATLVPRFRDRLAAVEEKRKERAAAIASSPDITEPGSQFSLSDELIGRWQGEIQTFEGAVPATFWFDNARSFAKIGDQQRTGLTRLRFDKRTLTADLFAELFTADTLRQPPGILELDLTLTGETLVGVVYANSLYGHKAFGGYRLNHWIELKKAQ